MDRSGTGLGLAVVWNTVQDHGGYVNVLSDEDGTIFELYFPITRDEVAAVVEQASWENYAINHETILVIDDERLQKEIECGLLIKLGYSATRHFPIPIVNFLQIISIHTYVYPKF